MYKTWFQKKVLSQNDDVQELRQLCVLEILEQDLFRMFSRTCTSILTVTEKSDSDF